MSTSSRKSEPQRGQLLVPSDSCVNGSGGVSGQESRAIGGELGRRRWGRTSCGTTCWPHLVVPRRENPGCQVKERIGCAAASHLMADPDAACRHADGEMDEAMMTDRGQAEQLPLPARPAATRAAARTGRPHCPRPTDRRALFLHRILPSARPCTHLCSAPLVLFQTLIASQLRPARRRGSWHRRRPRPPPTSPPTPCVSSPSLLPPVDARPSAFPVFLTVP
jgi:hypothetical protein